MSKGVTFVSLETSVFRSGKSASTPGWCVEASRTFRAKPCILGREPVRDPPPYPDQLREQLRELLFRDEKNLSAQPRENAVERKWRVCEP